MKNEKHYTIERKDGITYDKTYRVNDFDCNLNIRYWKEKKEELKLIAKFHGSNYNNLLRNVIDDYIKKEKKKIEYFTEAISSEKLTKAD